MHGSWLDAHNFTVIFDGFKSSICDWICKRGALFCKSGHILVGVVPIIETRIHMHVPVMKIWNYFDLAPFHGQRRLLNSSNISDRIMYKLWDFVQKCPYTYISCLIIEYMHSTFYGIE